MNITKDIREYKKKRNKMQRRTTLGEPFRFLRRGSPGGQVERRQRRVRDINAGLPGQKNGGTVTRPPFIKTVNSDYY